MRNIVLDFLHQNSKRRVKTKVVEDNVCVAMGLEQYWKQGGYPQFAEVMEQLVEQGYLKPIKAWKYNGMTPCLYNGYSFQGLPEVLDPKLRRKLLTFYHPLINVAHYLAEPRLYRDETVLLDRLDGYLKNNADDLNIPMTINERSFQIFSDEKLLACQEGQAFLQKLGIGLEDLSCYRTYEPFFYYQATQDVSHVLIVENKDTFFSIKQAMQSGFNRWDGRAIGLLIYGEGRKILHSISYLREIQVGALDGMQLWYFGDLDLEGIKIWFELQNGEWPVRPFVLFYSFLMKRYAKEAPLLKTGQRGQDDAIEAFLSFFSLAEGHNVKELVSHGRYLPQEGLYGQVLQQLAD